MIVCSCHRLTDRDIRRAHRPDGPGHCPAGTGCGNCLPLVSAITRECRQERPAFDDGESGPGAQRSNEPRDLTE